eukprot:15437834-Alexandrium_andersonii.AAC.1
MQFVLCGQDTRTVFPASLTLLKGCPLRPRTLDRLCFLRSKGKPARTAVLHDPCARGCTNPCTGGAQP